VRTSPHRSPVFHFQGQTPIFPRIICFCDLAPRHVKTLAPVHLDPRFETSDGISVSPDRKWLLYSGGVFTSDIMMIDNFRQISVTITEI